jgi:MFS family permease
MQSTPASSAAEDAGFRATLRHRDFTKLWVGQIVSSTGDTFYQFALLHVALGSSASGGLLASFGRDSARVIFCGMILPVLLARWIGQQIDRRDRQKIIFWTEVGRGVIALAMLATWAYGSRLAYLLGLVALSGLLTGLFIPARQAALPMLVPREHLVRANALMTFAGIVASLAGATAGLAVALMGESFSFLAAAIGFAFSAVMVWRIRRQLLPSGEKNENAVDNFSAPEVLATSRLLVWLTVAFTFVTGLFLPFFVQQVAANIDCSWLHHWISRTQDASFAGLIGLLGIAGLGLFAGMMTAGQVPKLAHWRLLPIAMLAVWGAAVWKVGSVGNYMPAAILCFFAGWSMSLITIPADARLQHEVAGDRHGRLFARRLALSNIAFLLGLALNLDGRLLAYFGPAKLLQALGIFSILSAVGFWFLFRKALHGSWGQHAIPTDEALVSTL